MKKICFSLIWGVVLFFAHSNLLAQSIDFLKAYEDKKIVSVIESKSETRQKGNSRTISGEIPMTVANTQGETNLWREITIWADRKKNQWITENTIRRFRLGNKNNGKGTMYDSDNAFERDEVGNFLAMEYDPIIGKPLKIRYNNKANVIDTLSTSNFEKLRRYTLSNVLTDESDTWRGIYFSGKYPLRWVAGIEWHDSLTTTLNQLTNHFTIKTITDNTAIITFKGSLQTQSAPVTSRPGAIEKPNEAKKQGRVEASNLTETATHEGEIVVNIDTKLINTITIRKQNIREMTVMGSKIETQSIVETKLTNTVQAIK